MAFFRRSSSLLRCALTRLHGHEQSGVLLQQQLSAQQADSVFKSFSPSPFLGARFMCSIPSTKLFVGGLAWGIDENALRESFVEYGEVVEAKVVLDRETGRSKGFGFVSFTCTDHAEAAKNGLDGKMLSGRPLRVNFAIEKQRGFGSFGGGFGGGDSSSSYGNSTDSGSGSFNNDGFAPSGSTNQENDTFVSNNTFNPDSLDTPSTSAASKESASAGENDNFFSDDIFDEHDDAFGKDENFAQGSK